MTHESPLKEVYENSEAVVAECCGWRLPRVFSSLHEEHRSATQRAALTDRSYARRLKVTGKDGLDLLNRLSTNKLETLDTGAGARTVLTTNKGRIVDVLDITQREDCLSVLISPGSAQRVIDWIDQYTFLEEIAVEDVTSATVMVHVLGPEAPAFLSDVTGQDVASLDRFHGRRATIDGAPVDLIRTDAYGPVGFDLIAPSSEAHRLWNALMELGSPFEFRPAGTEALETIRIENGVPVYGREISEKFNPQEANLLDYVSFNKGCYIGQEVVARLNAYDKVQKHLCGLVLDSEDVPPPQSRLMFDGKEAGFITSSARSPLLGVPVALGYVRRQYAETSNTFTAVWEGGNARCRLEQLPLTRVSVSTS